MSPKSVYVQECPICGRPLEISVEYLGKELICDHCGGRFIARDPASHGNPQSEQHDIMLHRVDELLDISEQRLGFQHSHHQSMGAGPR
jgi:DNA-directed RNA polymerase subunit RPC12/RpoP